jgi:PAS domain S-box-containing protein
MKNELIGPVICDESVHYIKGSHINPFQKLLDASLDVICSINEQGKFITVNAAVKTVWGYEPSELIGTYYMDLVSECSKAQTKQAAIDIMSGIDMTNFENQYVCKDGTVKPILWSARWDSGERVMYCVAKDETERKKAEIKTKTQERKLYRAYKLTGIAWWEFDISTQTYTSSDEIFEMYGIPLPSNNQFTVEEFLSYVHPDDVQKLRHDLIYYCEDTYFTYEHRVVKPNGEVIYVIHYSELIRNESGNPIALHGTTKNITQRKLYQLQLEASEKRLTEILESIGDGFFTLDNNWRVTYWNRKAEQLLGKKREDMIGKVIWDEFEDAVTRMFYSEYHRAVLSNTTVHFEEYLPSLDGWFEVGAYPSEDGLSVYFKNINERRRKDEALRVSNERFELVSKATRDAIYDYDIISGECYFNSTFNELFGHNNINNAFEKNWVNNIHINDKVKILASVKAAYSDKNVSQWEDEYKFIKADGSIAEVLDRGFIIRNEEGTAIRTVGSMQDVTKLKRAKEELNMLSLVVKGTVNAVLITNADDRLIWANKAFTDITEYNLDEVNGKRISEFLQGPKTDSDTKAYLKKCVQERVPFSCEILNYTKSGREIWLEVKGQPVFNEKGEVEQYFALQTDITKRKESEELIRLSEERYKLLFHKSSQPKWIFRADTYQITEVNEAAIHLYGYSREEFLNLSIPELKLKEDANEFMGLIQTHANNRDATYTNVVRHVKKSGKIFYVEIVSNCIELPTGDHFMATAKDMTEKMELEQMIIEEKVTAQKEVGRAVINAQEKERSEIGKELHDNVNQLLAAAKLYIENIKHFPEQSSHFIEKSRDILNKSINEVRFLSKQLVSPTIRDLGFKETIHELIEYYTELKVFAVDFVYDLEEEMLEEGVKFTLYRILQEQLNNTNKYAKATKVIIEVIQQKSELMLNYKDNGVGFDMATKKSGIGLKNIRNRVDVFKGKVHIEAAIGKGCAMQISFPVSQIVN